MGLRSDIVRERVDKILGHVSIVSVVGRVVKLGRGSKPRGQCPFHGSKSDSFAVDTDNSRARCWGCGWSGDTIRFVQDYYGLDFMAAVARLEDDHGLDGVSAAPVQREKAPVRRSRRDDAPRISSADMGRWLWKRAGRDLEPVRRYLTARGVPAGLLTAKRLADVRFMPSGPIVPWVAGEKPEGVPCAPMMLCLIRRTPGAPVEGEDWAPIGVHATFFNDACDGKMVRTKRDGSAYPARKMLGESRGGAVLLCAPGHGAGELAAESPLFVGEGLETVLSGMGLLGAPDDAAGLAVLSLDSLQGGARLIRGALPIHDPEPDPERPGVAFAHDGPVTLLIDADMKPLRGPMDPQSKVFRGVAVIDAPRTPIVTRTISQAERAQLCATLAARAWRAAGAGRVKAVRPRLGQDFNDAAREAV